MIGWNRQVVDIVHLTSTAIIVLVIKPLSAVATVYVPLIILTTFPLGIRVLCIETGGRSGYSDELKLTCQGMSGPAV
jgi:hypothetical protein